MSPDETNDNLAKAHTCTPSSSAIRYNVSDLLRGGREAVLEHNGSEYRLRITANGRLILTK